MVLFLIFTGGGISDLMIAELQCIAEDPNHQFIISEVSGLEDQLAAVPSFFACDAEVGSLAFSEIMFDGVDGEHWIEIYNPTDGSVRLDGFALSGLITYTFPGGTTLASGDRYVVSDADLTQAI